MISIEKLYEVLPGKMSNKSIAALPILTANGVSAELAIANRI
jgi:hypothetical protein